jgi:hypothetical protein
MKGNIKIPETQMTAAKNAAEITGVRITKQVKITDEFYLEIAFKTAAQLFDFFKLIHNKVTLK